MRVKQLSFSPTGGTARVARIVAEVLAGQGGTIEPVDLLAADFDGSDLDFGGRVALVAAPVFGGRVPQLAVDRVCGLHGDSCPAVLVAVYGGRAFEEALAELRDAAVSAGFIPCAAIAAVAEHSIVRSVAHARPDARDEDELAACAASIRRALETGSWRFDELEVPGTSPFKPRSKPPVPAPSDACTRCMRCAYECPVRAIDPTNPARVDVERCFGCMRCVSACHAGARSLAPEVLAGTASFLAQACPERADNSLFL